MPLLFNFHGGAGDIIGHLYTSDMRPIADTANFIAVYPQALGDPNDGYSANWMQKIQQIMMMCFLLKLLLRLYLLVYNQSKREYMSVGIL